MYALYEEAGKFLAGRVMSEAETSAQIELDSGKRVKVKAANILLKFDKPAPADLIAQGQALSAEVDLQLAWEFAPGDEFSFADLAKDYFQDPPTITEQAAALFALFNAPHYFRRAGKGRFKKAPADILAQALAGIEKKRLLAEQIEAWAKELAGGQCPEPVRDQLYKILFRPDKNAPEYKAVVEASRTSQQSPLALLQAAGAITSPYEFHWQRFLFDSFPKGTGFPKLAAPEITEELPLAEGVEAFSIDDSQTTEIDDAISVRGLGSGSIIVGVHIAAPGLALTSGDAIDAVARQRLSTVYMPGYKVTMLPDDVVQTYTLGEGMARPALSLYVTFDEATLEIKSTETRLEKVHIAANLRLDKIEDVVTDEWLRQAAPVASDSPNLPIAHDTLAFLYRLALDLKAKREVVRGKPENFNRPDYNFRLAGDNRVDGAEPTGEETVQISVRKRGAPLDLIVAEAMILANSTWGVWLADCGLPGLYRSQASLAPGIKVRMGTRALPHAGIGVPAYAWSTSPLRRYVDLVNQWQIIACARHGKTAALAAPFKPKDAQLFAILSAFDAAYTAYNSYQASMERFWTLRYIQQNGITEVEASVIKERMEGGFLVRADTLPLVLPVLVAQKLERGERLRVRLGDIDLITLDVSGTLIERLGADATGAANADDSNAEGEEEDDSDNAGPIAIAVDVNEAPSGDDASPAASPAAA